MIGAVPGAVKERSLWVPKSWTKHLIKHLLTSNFWWGWNIKVWRRCVSAATLMLIWAHIKLTSRLCSWLSAANHVFLSFSAILSWNFRMESALTKIILILNLLSWFRRFPALPVSHPVLIEVFMYHIILLLVLLGARKEDLRSKSAAHYLLNQSLFLLLFDLKLVIHALLKNQVNAGWFRESWSTSCDSLRLWVDLGYRLDFWLLERLVLFLSDLEGLSHLEVLAILDELNEASN